MAALIVIGFSLAVLYALVHRGAAPHIGDRRTDLVKELDLTPMGAHILGVPYKKRRR